MRHRDPGAVLHVGSPAWIILGSALMRGIDFTLTTLENYVRARAHTDSSDVESRGKRH